MLRLTAQRFTKRIEWMLALAALSGPAVGQTPAGQTAQESWKASCAQVVHFQGDAAAAFHREMDR